MMGLFGFASAVVVALSVSGQVEATYENALIENNISYYQDIGQIRYNLGGKPKSMNGKTFDCSGLIASFAYRKGLVTYEQYKRLNSYQIYNKGQKKALKDVSRGDIVYFQNLGTGYGHVAIATSERENGGIRILDAVGNGEIKKRKINIYNGVYSVRGKGRRKIKVSSNRMVDLQKQKDIEKMEKDAQEREMIQKREERVHIQRRTRQLLKRRGFDNMDVRQKASDKNGLKVEMMVCVAISETGLGKNYSRQRDIGNCGTKKEPENISQGIWNMASYCLNSKYLREKNTVGDLYPSAGSCTTNCNRFYASNGKVAQKNVLKCLSQLHVKDIGPDRVFRK